MQSHDSTPVAARITWWLSKCREGDIVLSIWRDKLKQTCFLTFPDFCLLILLINWGKPSCVFLHFPRESGTCPCTFPKHFWAHTGRLEFSLVPLWVPMVGPPEKRSKSYRNLGKSKHLWTYERKLNVPSWKNMQVPSTETYFLVLCSPSHLAGKMSHRWKIVPNTIC